MAERSDDTARSTRTAHGPRETAELLLGMLAIFAIAVVASLQIDFATAFRNPFDDALRMLQGISVAVIAATVVAAIFFGARRNQHALLRTFIVYLTVATLQIVGNISGLMDRAHVRQDNYLWGVWDVGACYLMIVAIFSGWYWVADKLTPGGAFDFPRREGRPAETPRLVDYVFIAFNVSSTFGPTSEAVMSRKVKVLMMVQTSFSLVILLVLVARVVGLQRG